MNENEFIFAEKYRPKKIDDVILPKKLKNIFKGYVKEGSVPNLLLHGSAGTGKTTVALALLNELGADRMVINGSTIGIDDLRNRITDFVSTVSMAGGRKYILINEADGLTPRFQDALREFIEECSEYVSFILTCNFKYKIIEPILSRFSEISFTHTKKDKKELMITFFKRLCVILDNEKIKYDKNVIAKVINHYYPDFRKVFSELQSYSKNGEIDEGILSLINSDDFKELYKLLKIKKFDDIIKWVGERSDIDTGSFYTGLFENMLQYIDSANDKAQFILFLAEGQVDESRAANLDINRIAVLTRIAGEIIFK